MHSINFSIHLAAMSFCCVLCLAILNKQVSTRVPDVHFCLPLSRFHCPCRRPRLPQWHVPEVEQRRPRLVLFGVRQGRASAVNLCPFVGVGVDLNL